MWSKQALLTFVLSLKKYFPYYIHFPLKKYVGNAVQTEQTTTQFIPSPPHKDPALYTPRSCQPRQWSIHAHGMAEQSILCGGGVGGV